VGIGYDVHKLVKGRPLVLGGVKFESAKGLEGHSDADVLCHAIGDALLGAIALGDLGAHFPPGDAQWKDASSLDLLKLIRAMLEGVGATIVNVDASVVCEEPKLAPKRAEMVENVAQALKLPAGQVSIKATTNEKLGFLGRNEGIAALAVASVATTAAADAARARGGTGDLAL
jgi:2-C-methyl-D-erythritol 2,4-cyclodiphosphate synthase